MGDYLYAQNDEEIEWSMYRGSCSCCSSQYYTDPEMGPQITQERVDSWETWLWEQLENVYKIRQTHNMGSMLQTYLPTLDLAWEVAIIKVRRLGKAWRGRDLPDTGVGNQVTAGIMGALEAFEDSLPEADRGKQRDIEDENYDMLSTVLFEEQAKGEDD